MSLTESTMLPLGTRMPDFELPDVVSGRYVSSAQWQGFDAMLVMFMCRHCPYVIHVREELARLGRDYQLPRVAIVAVSSNDVQQYPQDHPRELKNMAEELGFSFPFCYDESQEVAKRFTAACTPDFFVFDGERRLVYRGQLDESRPGNGKPVTGADLRAALDATLAGKPIASLQKPSAGCNIKWKTGNKPDYF